MKVYTEAIWESNAYFSRKIIHILIAGRLSGGVSEVCTSTISLFLYCNGFTLIPTAVQQMTRIEGFKYQASDG